MASNILITDVLSFIFKHQVDYMEFVDNEYTKGNITKEEYYYELQTIKMLNEKDSNNEIKGRQKTKTINKLAV